MIQLLSRSTPALQRTVSYFKNYTLQNLNVTQKRDITLLIHTCAFLTTEQSQSTASQYELIRGHL